MTMPPIPIDSAVGIRGLPPFVTYREWRCWVEKCIRSAAARRGAVGFRRHEFRRQMAHAERVAELHVTAGWARELPPVSSSVIRATGWDAWKDIDTDAVLDIGVVPDRDLNTTNDVTIFAEYRGPVELF